MTSAEIHYLHSGKVVNLLKHQIDSMKEIFTRNVIPEARRHFINDIKIDLFKDSTELANIMVSLDSDIPFANFNSDSLNFGFRLTYRIGMFLGELP